MQAPPKKKARVSADRALDESLERSIMRKFAHLPLEIIETVKVRGKTIRQHVASQRTTLKEKGRIGSTFWTSLVNDVTMAVGALVDVRPQHKDSNILCV